MFGPGLTTPYTTVARRLEVGGLVRVASSRVGPSPVVVTDPPGPSTRSHLRITKTGGAEVRRPKRRRRLGRWCRWCSPVCPNLTLATPSGRLRPTMPTRPNPHGREPINSYLTRLIFVSLRPPLPATGLRVSRDGPFGDTGSLTSVASHLVLDVLPSESLLVGGVPGKRNGVGSRSSPDPASSEYHPPWGRGRV